MDGFLFKRAALKILLLVRCRSFIPLILPYFGLGAICTVQPSDAKVKMWSIMCSPISTVITQWDSRGLSMVGRSIALHFACNILECKICIVPMLLKVLEHWFPFFPNFVLLKTCSSGCDSCPDHQHDWRGSFPCYCKAFGGDNRGNLPQILVLNLFIVGFWVVHCQNLLWRSHAISLFESILWLWYFGDPNHDRFIR